jgi:acid phosphatase type 7
MLRVAAVVAGVAVLAVVILLALGNEKVEQVIAPETGALRPPTGEWIPSVPGRRAELWAVGDSGPPRWAAVGKLIADAKPDRLLYLGDVYPRGRQEDFEAWARAFRGLVERTAPTPGNHDWPEAVDGYEPFWLKVTGETPPTFYAFRAGGWKILSANSEHSDQGAVQRWLEDETAGGDNCIVAFWHRPRFSAGPRGNENDVQELWEAVRGRARIMIGAHEHDMQRLAPDEGTVQFVSGAGGFSHHDVADEPRVLFSNSTVDGALRLRLEPGLARYAFVAVGGRVLDSGSLRCHA